MEEDWRSVAVRLLILVLTCNYHVEDYESSWFNHGDMGDSVHMHCSCASYIIKNVKTFALTDELVMFT